MTFLFVLSPVSTKTVSPTIKPVNPTVNTLTRLETPARVQGVEYEFKEEVKKLSTSTNYEFKPLTLDKFASFEKKTEDGAVGTALDKGELSLDKINGIKYPDGSKLLSITQGASSFTPKTNEIYVDEVEGTAFKILGTESDDSGNTEYVIGTPKLAEVFKSYTIPEQTLNLTTGNIAFIADEFELSAESGMTMNTLASAGPWDDIIDVAQVGNKHILTLKEGITIFKHPFEEPRISDKDAKEMDDQAKFDGDWWEKEQYSDLRGVEDKSELSVEVKVKAGTITIEDPQFHAYFDLNPWISHVVAGFYFDAKTEADITLADDITFNKTIEKCVYGYDIDLGKVMGKDKANKAFVGIFVVIGVESKIHVKVRTRRCKSRIYLQGVWIWKLTLLCRSLCRL